MGRDEGHDQEPDEARPAAVGPGVPIDRTTAQAFGLGALVGVVLLGLVWATFAAAANDRSPAGRASQAGLLDRARGTADKPHGPTPVQRCATVAGALLAPLSAAGPSLDQWEVHVGAMNRLVVGAITLRQATAFWNQTRVGAKARIADFHRADRVARRVDVTCPTRRLPAHASRDLRACVRQVRADTRALGAARTAVHTWEMHVLDMERLRSGKLSPAAATTMWLSMWQRGVKQLHDFHDAERGARRNDTCYVPVG